MRTTQHQDTSLADMILDWVRGEVSVDDLYGEDAVKQYIKESFNPEDVFSTAELSVWAFENGYRRFE